MKNNMRMQSALVISLSLSISFALAMDQQDKDKSKKEQKSLSEKMVEAVPMTESAVQKKRSQLTSLQSIGGRVYLASQLGQLQETQEEEQQIKQVMRELRAQARKVGTVQEDVAPEPVVIKTVEEGLDYLAKRFGLEFVHYENMQPLASLAESQEHVLAFEAPYIQTDYVAPYEHRPSLSLVLHQESMPLYKAIASGNSQTLAAYLKEVQDGGGDLKTLGDGLDIDQHGFAPLNWVLIPDLDITAETRIAMLDMLLTAGLDIHSPSNFGRTAVHDAILSELPEAHKIFEFLYEKYVLSDLIDFGGQTPLHAAVAKGLMEPVTFLLGRKPNLEARDFKERTPLQVVFDEHLPSKVKAVIADALIKAGANMEVVDTDGNPLIFDVINKVDLVGVELLLGHGANCRSTNLQNHTVLEFAQEKISKTEKKEAATHIYEVVKEYVEGKRLPRGTKPVAQHISIAIPESLQGKVDVAAFREQIRIMLTTQEADGTSLLSKALVHSLIKENHEK